MTKQIDIQELIPYLKDGWVAMDKNGYWVWFSDKPFIEDRDNWLVSDGMFEPLTAFNIKPVENWEKSLIKVENNNV